MKLAALSTLTAAVLLAIGACTASAPPVSDLADLETDRPEPVRAASSAAATAPPLTGFALAVTTGATELYVVDMDRVELTHPAGTVGAAKGDSAATLAHVREVVAGLRFWAEDGAVIVYGPPPFTGRARSQTRGGVLRFSLTPRPGMRSGERTLAAEVRGGEITGRVSQHSPAGDPRTWAHGAFFHAPLRPVGSAEWPPRAPRGLSAERIPGGVLLRWTVARHASADAEYVVYRADDAKGDAIEVGTTREMQFVDATPGAARGGPSPVWHVATRSASGALSTPSPSATRP
ncbi:hypothetical protein [Longimicrobium sp.]|uniref:hypothetical protein n=1 Tax=Longimicrobium sp. TaxID=2029185 RepID=UPI002E33F526|nr:hypothetical protein [Longimicrobium sp.]HEX6041177.1 hypothetical protein [Longimicrobium sp.]